ncbi:MAG: hypothetical protein VKJ06_03515 [Vampirovibrionales bacterium]|nr:hypothetical protein [Vampirovibrionales bacterium]
MPLMSSAPGVTEPVTAADAALSTTITLVGHVIDSLTLTKVIDIILSRGGNYLVNEIRVGNRKSDFSYVTLTLEAPNAATMQVLLSEIAPHGARPLGDQEHASLIKIEQAATLPEQAYTLPHVPTAVNIKSEGFHGWAPIVSDDVQERVLRFDPSSQQVQVVAVQALSVGDLILANPKGLSWTKQA